MADEILFRGKRLDNGEWVEGYLLADDDLLPGAYICQKMTITCRKSGEMLMGGFICVDPSTICRYTGLTGKNDVRIFEGDILRGRNEEYRKTYGDPVVVIGEYRENDYVRRYGSDDYDDEDVPVGYGVHLQANGQACGIDSSCTDFFEVIGNRWDNPELMPPPPGEEEA